jgi:23S rRNA (pseudouridine1915-N3)-methyltransferase
LAEGQVSRRQQNPGRLKVWLLKVQIVKIGKPAFPEVKALTQMYESRLSGFVASEGVEIKDPKVSAQSLLDFGKVPASEQRLVVLDERGKQLKSTDLASQLRAWTDDPRVKLVRFVVGGPYGFDDATRSAASLVWSLSQSTLPSDLAWLICWEQVYRAYNILRGTSYHHS